MSVPAWRSQAHRRQHFEAHRRALWVRTVEQYHQSALDVVEIGTYFEFIDDESGEPRVGYYDRWTERLTVLSDDERVIHTHFHCPERYVESRRGSTYT